jgi:ABC-2 type transport system ATP-binding protein
MNIKVQNVTKSYDKLLVLNNINLEFKEGETYCVIGKNGAGKSTFFNIVSGLLHADSGDILFDDKSYKQLPNYIKKKTGLLNNVSSLIQELTAYQYLSLIAQFYSINKNDREEKIEKMFAFFFPDKKEIASLKILAFSTGMKRKLEVCSCIMHNPEVLILDEPFSGLDPLAAENIITFFSQYSQKNRTIIFSSHNLDYVEKINPILILIDETVIKFQGRVTEFVQSSGKNFHESLLEILNYKESKQSLSWV